MQKRFTDATYEYVMAVKNQVGNRESAVCPSIEEYVSLRRDTSAIKVTYACIEYCLNIDVPDHAFFHPSVLALQEAGNDILAWANDIYSFDNEQCSGDCHNLVAVVAINKNITIQAAMEYAMGMTESAIARFWEECSKVPSFGPEVDTLVQSYIKGVELYLSGSVFWHLESERYFGPRVKHVKDTLKVELRPLENGAKPDFELMYKLPSNLTPEVLSATYNAATATHGHARINGHASTPSSSSSSSPNALASGSGSPRVHRAPSPVKAPTPVPSAPSCPPPSYADQRFMAKTMAAYIDEKQQRIAQPPQYLSPQQQQFQQFQQWQQQLQQAQQQQSQQQFHQQQQQQQQFQQQFQQQDAQFKHGNPIANALARPTSELASILVIASFLLASSPYALIPFVPLLALLLFPEAPAAILA
jgi:hypothetical protein